jgi:hypothetical protein
MMKYYSNIKELILTHNFDPLVLDINLTNHKKIMYRP